MSSQTRRYVITVDFFEDGQTMVQVEGDPYPLGIFKETGWDDERLLQDARGAIINDFNAALSKAEGA